VGGRVGGSVGLMAQGQDATASWTHTQTAMQLVYGFYAAVLESWREGWVVKVGVAHTWVV